MIADLAIILLFVGALYAGAFKLLRFLGLK